MTTGTYRYQNEDRSVFFRGWLRWYEGPRRYELTAPLVRSIKTEALRDAKAMRRMADERGANTLAQMLNCGLKNNRSRLWRK